MNYSEIIKRAFNIVLKNRFLWFLGIFLGGGSCSNLFRYDFSGSDYKNWENNGNNIATNITNSAHANVKSLGQALGESIGPNSSDMAWFIAILALVIILILLLIYLSITAKGGATWAVVKINKGAEYSLGQAWKAGHKYFWRRLSFALIVAAAVILIMTVLAVPIILLAIFDQTTLSIISGVIFGMALVVLLVYFSLILPYAERVLFLENRNTIESIKHGIKLFNGNWKQIVLLYLILIGIGIGAGICIMIAFLISAGIIFLLSALIYIGSHVVAFIFGGLCLLALVVTTIAVSGALQTFNWAAITLGYEEVRGKPDNA